VHVCQRTTGLALAGRGAHEVDEVGVGHGGVLRGGGGPAGLRGERGPRSMPSLTVDVNVE
jgi:hypothetical protein